MECYSFITNVMQEYLMTWKVVYDIFLNKTVGYETVDKHASNFIENMCICAYLKKYIASH